MIQFTLKQHPDDSDMIEIREKQPNGSTLAYALFHSDLIYRDERLREALKVNGEADVVLMLEGEQ